MKRIIALALGSVLLLAACGADSGDPQEVPTDASVSDPLPTSDDAGATFPSGMGPGISVAEALAANSDEPLLVNGFVFVYADGTIVLADAIAESFPPQPAGAEVFVGGLDIIQIPLTEAPADSEVDIVSWTDQQVQLVGNMVDGLFVGNSVASA